MALHIGKTIAAKIKEVGMSKAEFGRRIDTSRQNVNSLLQKSTLDVSTLTKISNVLETNFFDHYIKQLEFLKKDEPPAPINNQISLTLNIPAEMQQNLLHTLFEGNVPKVYQRLP